MLRSFDPGGSRDIVFVPVGINYDRTFEDRSFLRELDPRRRRRGAAAALRRRRGSSCRNLWLMARNRWHRFGYACVNFGSPFSLQASTLAARGVDFRALPRRGALRARSSSSRAS